MKNKDKNLNDYAYCPNSCPVISKSQTEAVGRKKERNEHLKETERKMNKKY